MRGNLPFTRQRYIADMWGITNFRLSAVAAMFGAAILLAGCQSYGERVIARAQRLDVCGAKPIREFVGRTADQPTREAIEQRVPNAQEIRWISPGDEIIANLSTGRINISLNENGKIQYIGCY